MFELHLVDIDYDLIDHLSSMIKDIKKDKIIFISANRRPIRFVEQKIDSHHILKTDFYILDEFVKDFVQYFSDNPPTIQTPIERYFFIHDLLKENLELYNKLGGSIQKVFPWCKRISSLFDEIDKHRVENRLQNFQYTELVEPSRGIVENLKNLYRRYKERMEEKNLTYTGDLYAQMLNILNSKKTFPDYENTAFILTNLVYISVTEVEILKKLSELSDLHFVVYDDLKNRGDMFESFTAVENLKKRLQKTLSMKINEVLDSKTFKKPEINFYSFNDTISEMDHLANILYDGYQNVEAPNDTAVILPDETSLYPLLINLPLDYKPNINITMGYPFIKTTLYILLSNLFELCIDIKKGLYDTLKIPAEKLITICDYSSIFYDQDLKKNLKDIKSHIYSVQRSIIEIEKERFTHFYNLIMNFIEISTIHDLSSNLEYLTSLMHRYPPEKLKEQIFTVNAINIFVEKFLETLKKLPNDKEINVELSYIIFKEISKDILIPFEGSPLRGLQIMGILEARGLKFKHLFIPDMNEGVIPSVDKVDPLIPESIKRIIGLPSYEEKEILMRYNFFRLVYSAKKVYLFFKTGMGDNSKFIRSRYVDQLILKEELDDNQEFVNIYKPQSNFFTPKHETLSFPKPCDISLKSYSPTALDCYLSCPYKYYLRYIKQIPPSINIDSDFKADKVGSIVHAILEETIEVDKPVKDSFSVENALTVIDRVREQDSHLTTKINNDDNLKNYILDMSELEYEMFKKILEYRFNNFLRTHFNDENLKNSIVMAKEKMIKKGKLEGVVDRIDRLGDKLLIIDYKTGNSLKPPSKRKVNQLSDKIGDFGINREDLLSLKEDLKSVQLLTYIVLASSKYKADEYEGIYYLFSKNNGNIVKFKVENEVENIIAYIINHIEKTDQIYPLPDKDCVYCEYNKMCRFV
ncbi:PD-(D/E)XK nuclease family protein [Calditerrivibrio sp.]|uniref:PD-(D/E)XK nuclease family protein n=1 Tax=Calditerrivibrio sp. TaxID=2792612 RepID=UPI003D098E9B